MGNFSSWRNFQNETSATGETLKAKLQQLQKLPKGNFSSWRNLQQEALAAGETFNRKLQQLENLQQETLAAGELAIGNFSSQRNLQQETLAAGEKIRYSREVKNLPFLKDLIFLPELFQRYRFMTIFIFLIGNRFKFVLIIALRLNFCFFNSIIITMENKVSLINHLLH